MSHVSQASVSSASFLEPPLELTDPPEDVEPVVHVGVLPDVLDEAPAYLEHEAVAVLVDDTARVLAEALRLHRDELPGLDDPAWPEPPRAAEHGAERGDQWRPGRHRDSPEHRLGGRPVGRAVGPA